MNTANTNWHHAVFGFNQSHIYTYYDGELDDIDPCNMANVRSLNGTLQIAVDSSTDFNGIIDEVMIFSRALSSQEILALYDAGNNKLFRNFTSLSEGEYTVKAYAIDEGGNINNTETRTITYSSDSRPPSWNKNQTNLTTDNVRYDDVWFYVNWSDDVALSHYIFSWNGTNGTWTNDTAVAMTSLINQSNITKTINLTRGNIIGWRIYANDSSNKWNYTDTSTFLVNNSIITTPDLSFPLNTSSITNTTPLFNWTNSTDNDNDTLLYDIFIRCLGGCSVDNREVYNLTVPYYVPTAPLQYYSDDGYAYEWYVRPFDNFSYGTNTSKYNFTIASSVTISLPVANISFGSMNINTQNDTTDDSPQPIKLQNDGNCYININITVDSYLWSSEQQASRYFQYKIDNVSGEEGAFNSSWSATDWSNFTITNSTGIYQLNYSDTKDSVEIDLNLTVPPDEPIGDKQSNILFSAYYVRLT